MVPSEGHNRVRQGNLTVMIIRPVDVFTCGIECFQVEWTDIRLVSLLLDFRV